jgi:hypothetical protein
LANSYYTRVAAFTSRTKAKSDDVRSELDAISAAFDNFPAVTGNGEGFSDPVKVGTATEPNHAATLQQLNDATTGNAQNASDAQAAQQAAEAARDTSVAASNTAVLAANGVTEWAVKPEDSPVSVAAGGNNSTDFSALHWAAKAKASALAANTWNTANYYTKSEVATQIANSMSVNSSGEILLLTQTVNTPVGAIDFTGIDGTYKDYFIKFTDVQHDGNSAPVGTIIIVTSGDNGVTFDEALTPYKTNYNFQHTSYVGGGAQLGQDSDNIPLIYRLNATASDTGSGSGEINIFNAADASTKTLITTESDFSGSSGLMTQKSRGLRNVTEVMNAIRIKGESSLISSGTFSLYGVLR